MKREEILKKLEEIHQKVNANEQLSQLELDILKDNIRDLYSKVLEWEPITNIPESEQAPEMHVVQPEEPEPLTPKPEPEPSIAETPKIEEPDIIPSYEETVQPPEVEPEVPEPISAPQTVEKEIEVEKEDIPQSTQESQSTQPEKKDHNIVAEKLESGQEDNTIAGRWNRNPISDLKSAIGLNDKFSFIHGLFKGKVDAYNEAIEKLNTSSGIDAARQYFEFLSNEYSWDTNSPEYLKLKEFVERRFAQ